MRIVMLCLLFTPLLLLAEPPTADACQARSVPLADAVGYADRLIVATIVATKTLRPARRGRTATLTVRARVQDLIAGSAKTNSLVDLTYSEPMPIHRPGGVTRCPMWVGSRIEFNLKVGTAYYLLTSRSGLVRAVAASKAAAVRKAWTQRHWSSVDSPRARRANLVMRARFIGARAGNLNHWTSVQPLTVFKNSSGRVFKSPMLIAHSGSEPPLRAGTYTLYLEPYSAKSKHYRLVDAKLSAGATHYLTPTKQPAPRVPR